MSCDRRKVFDGRFSMLDARCSMVAALLLAVCVLIQSCSGGCPLIKRSQPIQPSAKTEDKFDSLSQWIPDSTNAVVIVDVYRLASSKLWNKLLQSKESTIKNYFKIPGIDFKSDIGMIVAFMEIFSPAKVNGPVLLIQGGFHQDLVISRIIEEAKTDKINLPEEKYKDFVIYSENPDDADKDTGDKKQNPSAFVAIGDGIIAMGSPENLRWIIDNRPKKAGPRAALTQGVNWEEAVWGRMTVTDTLKNALPPPWNQINSIQLGANVQDDIGARLVVGVDKGADAGRLKSMIEGLIAIEALQRLDEKEILHLIDTITIKETDGGVVVEIPEDAKFLSTLFPEDREADETNSRE